MVVSGVNDGSALGRSTTGSGAKDDSGRLPIAGEFAVAGEGMAKLAAAISTVDCQAATDSAGVGWRVCAVGGGCGAAGPGGSRR